MASILFRPQWVNWLTLNRSARSHPMIIDNPFVSRFSVCQQNCIAITVTLHEDHGMSNHWQQDKSFNILFRLTTKKTQELRTTAALWWEPSMTGGFPLKGSVMWTKLGKTECMSHVWFCRGFDCRSIREKQNERILLDFAIKIGISIITSVPVQS